ncbi:hypothetical protein RvY_08786 [Ramazzottius varieornatus]|uniref:Phenylalanine--tRNA ligase beta subunit n=1 Tax=Ramazzottius varieornatus TaxID=947166 RepID=A0A1D1V772_RAMVA|nr:hypothetical protein RvY_08786 [Ramazzottius varieornatus]
MPTISVKRDELFEVMQHTYEDEEFDELCFQYGIELDEVTTEKAIAVKEQGESVKRKEKDGGPVSEAVLYKIEIPANRYDLLCLEGLSLALKVFLGKCPIAHYALSQPTSGQRERITVTKQTGQIRPFVVGAILRNISLTASSYASFIELQDKLHQNLCRKRTLVAIGTHDLDTVSGPFTYDALPPDQIKFRPLNQTKEMTATELMDFYATDSHLKPYLHIIKDSPVYPVIKDKNGIVCSLPPIINGDHSKLTLNTKNVLIECTATDLHKAVVVLDTVVTMFSQHCSPQFMVEPVDVVGADGNTITYPKLVTRQMVVSCSHINKRVGINVPIGEMIELLRRMGLESQLSGPDGDSLMVKIPPTRHDILHPCDLIEDVAIAYGYNNIEKKMPPSMTIGDQFIVNHVSDLLRNEMVAAGYTESLTFALCSRDDIGEKLRHKIEDIPAVHIANPKSLEFQVARTTLIPGLLKTVASNKKMSLPIKLFEISDVVLKDSTKEVGARNHRRLSALYYGKTSGFEIVHGLVDRFMQLVGIPYAKDSIGYHIRAHQDKTFFDGRCAQIVVHDKAVGLFGVLHPEVLHHFELTNPCSIMELDVEPFV